MDISGIVTTLSIIGIVIAVFVIGFVIYLRIRDFKRYNIICIIIERASGGIPILSSDVGGVFVDTKTNNKRFYLKNNAVGLDPDNIPFILNINGQKVVYLLRFGLKNFKYINIKLPSDNTYIIEVGEEDVNWAVNAYEKYKKVFGQSLLDKLLPYIAIAITGMITLGIVYVLVQKFDVLQGVVTTIKEIVIIQAQGQTGTTIIQ